MKNGAAKSCLDKHPKRGVRIMNAIELLKADHARVQELFRQYEEADVMAEDEDLVTEALEEHREVKSLIATLRTLALRDAQFQTTFAELREGVEGHVGMEEDELMPDAEAVLGDELERLGRQMEERKEQLMADKS